MLLRAANRAAQAPALLVEETLNGDIGRTHLVVNVEALGLVADRELVLRPIERFLRSADPLVTEAAIQALRLLYIRETSAFPLFVRDALVDASVSSTNPSVRLLAAICLADLSFAEI
jgi:hypothetical protein